MHSWFPNKSRGLAVLLAALGCGCAFHGAPKPAAPASSSARVDAAKEEMAAEGVSIAHDFFLRARRMEMGNNNAVALGYYRIAFEYDPTSRDLCFLLLDHLKDAGRIDTAIALGKTCLELKGTPTSDQYQSLGEAYLKKEDARAALEYYRQALALDENDKDVLFTVTHLYEQLHDLPHFTEAMEKLLPQLEYPPRLVEKQLQAYRALGRPDDEVRLLREAWEKTGRVSFGENLAAYYDARDLNQSFLEIATALARGNPENAGYALLRARALMACQWPDSALAVYQTLLRRSPEAAEVLFPYAVLLQEQGKFESAYRIFEKLSHRDPDHPLYQFYLGTTGLELRKPSALEALEKAVSLDPDAPDYWARLAYGQWVFGHDSLAARVLARIPDSLGEAWQTPFFQGLVHSMLARFLGSEDGSETPPLRKDSTAARRYRQQAVDFFRAAQKQNPQNLQVQFELGANLERLGSREEAVEVLRKLVQVDTGNALALNYLGYMLVEDNRDLDLAGKLIDRALSLEPENGAYLDSKGWWHYRKGDFSAARLYLEKAEALFPNDPTILEHLATVLDQLGEGQAARKVWERLRRVHPENAEAKRRAGLAAPASKAAEVEPPKPQGEGL